MKTKMTLLLFAICFSAFNANAWSLVNGNFESLPTPISIVGSTIASMSPQPVDFTKGPWTTWNITTGGDWGFQYGGTSYRNIDFSTIADPDNTSGQVTVASITSSGGNTFGASPVNGNLGSLARLGQRISGVPVGTYTVQFRAKVNSAWLSANAATAGTCRLVLILRSTPTSNSPAFVTTTGTSNGYAEFPAITDQWVTYSAVFDLSNTLATYNGSPAVAVTATQNPVITFTIISPTTGGKTVYIDDVTFTAASGTTTAVNSVSEDSKIAAVVTYNQMKVSNVTGLVSIYNSLGKLVAQKTAVSNSVDFDINGTGIYIISNNGKKIKIIV